jgi:hypothetical protein
MRDRRAFWLLPLMSVFRFQYSIRVNRLTTRNSGITGRSEALQAGPSKTHKLELSGSALISSQLKLLIPATAPRRICVCAQMPLTRSCRPVSKGREREHCKFIDVVTGP